MGHFGGLYKYFSKNWKRFVVSSSKSAERLTANRMWDIKVYHIGSSHPRMNKVDGS